MTRSLSLVMLRRTALACALVLGLSATASCARTEPSAGDAARVATSSKAPSSEASPDVFEGPVDVGGHELYVRCAGAGEPTVVFLHGADPEQDPITYSRRLEKELVDDHRFCVYDRRNIGRSDRVDAPQLPGDMLTDLDAVLAAANEPGPYLLLGASFGGLLAYAYAGAHADKVSGIVALDSMFPDELALEHLIPAEDRYESFVESDEAGDTSVERIAHFKMLTYAGEQLPPNPDVPLTYLASKQEPRNTTGIKEYDEQIHDALAAFVDRFSPGKLVWVDAPHFMEPVIPAQIADEVSAIPVADRTP